jgi:alpha-1,6-mannosyltransferase
VTLLFAPTSGGVRRYLLAKHDRLTRCSRLHHTVLVPGPRDSGIPCGITHVGSPTVPFARGYRVPLRMHLFREALERQRPNLIEVGDAYRLGRLSLQVAQQHAR